MFEFFRAFGGAFPLATTCEPHDPAVLNVQACHGPGEGMDLYAVNRGTQPHALSLSLPTGMSPLRIRVLDAEHRLVTNTIDEDRIRYRELEAKGPITLDPLSVTHIVLGSG